MAGQGEEKQGEDSSHPKPLTDALQRLVIGSGASKTGCMPIHPAAAAKPCLRWALVLISPLPLVAYLSCRPVGTPSVSPPGRAAEASRVLGDAAGGAVPRRRGGGAFAYCLCRGPCYYL